MARAEHGVTMIELRAGSNSFAVRNIGAVHALRDVDVDPLDHAERVLRH
jgi:hypothetical protein